MPVFWFSLVLLRAVWSFALLCLRLLFEARWEDEMTGLQRREPVGLVALANLAYLAYLVYLTRLTRLARLARLVTTCCCSGIYEVVEFEGETGN